MTPTLYMFCGWSASGKSTLVSPISSEDAVRLCQMSSA